jgi:hypothetical protein
MPDAVDHSPLHTCPLCKGSMIPGDIYCFGCWCGTSKEERIALLKAAGNTDQKASKPDAKQNPDGLGFMESAPKRRGRR